MNELTMNQPGLGRNPVREESRRVEPSLSNRHWPFAFLSVFLLLCCLQPLATRAGEYETAYSGTQQTTTVRLEAGRHTFKVTGIPSNVITKWRRSDLTNHFQRTERPQAYDATYRVTVGVQEARIAADFFTIDSDGEDVFTHAAVWELDFGSPVPNPVTNTVPANGTTYPEGRQPLLLKWDMDEFAQEYDVILEHENQNPTQVIQTIFTGRWPLNQSLLPGVWYWTIRARNQTGESTGPIWQFTIPEPQVPGEFENARPFNNRDFTGVEQPRFLDWSQSSRADTYEVYLELDNPNPTRRVDTLTRSRWTVNESLPTGRYYWRIVAVNGFGRTEGPTWTFTIPEKVIPESFNNVSPSNGAVLDQHTASLTFEWTPSGMAANYDVILEPRDTTPDFRFARTDSTQWVLSRTLRPGQYFWKIVARTASGFRDGPTWSFTIEDSNGPGLFRNLRPQNGLEFSTGRQPRALAWSFSPKATSYQVFMDRGSETPTTLLGTVTDTRITLPDTLLPGTWFWRVVARNDQGTLQGPTWRFEIPEAPAIEPFENLKPADGHVYSPRRQPTFLDWTTSSTATFYDVYLDKDVETPTTLVASTPNSRYQLNQTLSPGTWTWRVVARSNSGELAGSTWSFEIPSIPLPEAFDYVRPRNEEIIDLVEAPEFLDWSHSTFVSTYKVFLDLGNPNPTTQIASVTGSRYRFETPLTEEGTYYWKVIATNEAGETEGEVWSFTLQKRDRVLLLLHGMNSKPSAWNDFTAENFNNQAPILQNGMNASRIPAQPNAHGVYCYRVDFGFYDGQINNGRVGLEGLRATGDMGGDFSTFDTLGLEVFEAVNYVLATHSSPRITLLGHSRGGLAARAFLQEQLSSNEKNSIVALLTTGTPHQGSPLGRLYNYFDQHPRANAEGNPEEDDWKLLDELNGSRAIFGFKTLSPEEGLDVRRPTIGDLADNSPAIAALNQSVVHLPPGISYGAMIYRSVPIGVIQRWIGIGLVSVWESNADPLTDGSTQSRNFVLGVNQTERARIFLGDGIVPANSQRLVNIRGFPGRTYRSFNFIPATRFAWTIHVEETGQTAQLRDSLSSLTRWW